MRRRLAPLANVPLTIFLVVLYLYPWYCQYFVVDSARGLLTSEYGMDLDEVEDWRDQAD